MLKTILVVIVYFGILATNECRGLSINFNRKTANEQLEELPTTTTTSTSSNDRVPAGYYKVNNVPKVEEGCKIRYECKKKLKHAETPKPCIKYCVKNIECENGKKSFGAPGQCVELNEEVVAQEYNDCRKDENTSITPIMQVAMIDFPCQPGYLPDSRGRCREIW